MSVPLYQRVEEANFKLQHWGWCDLHKANTLAAMVVALRPKLACEIGVFGGRSLIAIALAMKDNGAGKIIGIDPWSKEAALEGMNDPANIKWWSELDYEKVRETCLATLREFGVESQVEIIRSKSDDVDPSQWVLDLGHIDGSHEETAYRDTIRFAPSLRVGGLWIMDDIGWVSGAPKRGVEWLLANGFVELYPLGTGAVFQRMQ